MFYKLVEISFQPDIWIHFCRLDQDSIISVCDFKILSVNIEFFLVEGLDFEALSDREAIFFFQYHVENWLGLKVKMFHINISTHNYGSCINFFITFPLFSTLLFLIQSVRKYNILRLNNLYSNYKKISSIDFFVYQYIIV